MYIVKLIVIKVSYWKYFYKSSSTLSKLIDSPLNDGVFDFLVMSSAWSSLEGRPRRMSDIEKGVRDICFLWAFPESLATPTFNMVCRR